MRKVLLALFCAASLVATAQTTVTFRVDMSQQTINPAGVSVAGTWQAAAGQPADWTPGAAMMTDADSDGVYEYTCTLPSGSYAYKFVNGIAWGSDEGVPGACAVNNNREINVSGASVTTPLVCYGSCSPCQTVIPVTVTMSVDMNALIAAGIPIADTVSVAGNFQGQLPGIANWSPGATRLLDADNDKIYEATFVINSGTYAYKFLNGNAWGTDEAIPCACVSGGNREMVIPSTSSTFTLTPIAFGTCGAAPSVVSNITFRLDMSNEIPDASGVKLRVFKPFPATIDMVQVGGAGDCWEAVVPIGNGDYVYDFINGTDENGNALSSCGCEFFGGDKRRSLVVGTTSQVLPVATYNDCTTSTANCQVSNGITSAAFGEVNVTPNPFGASTVITFENSGEATLRITDLTGRVLSVVGNITTNTVSVERNNMAAGMYIATLVNAKGETASFKLVVE